MGREVPGIFMDCPLVVLFKAWVLLVKQWWENVFGHLKCCQMMYCIVLRISLKSPIELNFRAVTNISLVTRAVQELQEFSFLLCVFNNK